jgi:hypothetical protein
MCSLAIRNALRNGLRSASRVMTVRGPNVSDWPQDIGRKLLPWQ